MFRFCPRCGKSDIPFLGNKHLECQDCGFTLYLNVATATAAILLYQGNIVALRRNRDPGKGQLDLPGGFVDPGENAETAMLRELREELGVAPDSLRYLASFPNRYLYREVEYATCDLFFTGTLREAPRVNDPDENSQLLLLDPKAIQIAEFAFPSIRRGLELYLSNRQ